MTTALVSDPKPVKSAAVAAYTRERRSNAAKRGWAMRRYVPEPTPESLARDRLEAVIATLDPEAARLYACQVAATVVHHYTARYPGDEGCDTAITAARRFAQGSLREWGRQRANTASRRLVTRSGDDAGCFLRPFHSAANAASWCLNRDARIGLYWAIIWAVACEEPARRATALERHCDELEARRRAAEYAT